MSRESINDKYERYTVTNFVEKRIEDGWLHPDDRHQTIQKLLAISDSIQFAESGSTESPRQAAMREMTEREIVDGMDVRSIVLHRKIENYAARHSCDYVEAAQAVTRELNIAL